SYGYRLIPMENTISGIPKSYQSQEIKTLDFISTKSISFEGDIKLLESNYLSRIDKGNKDLFMDNMSNISFEKNITSNEMSIADRSVIVNGQIMDGYLSMPLEYNSYQPKNVSMLGEIYINGKKAFNKYIKQQNKFNRMLGIYYPTEPLKPLLTEHD